MMNSNSKLFNTVIIIQQNFLILNLAAIYIVRSINNHQGFNLNFKILLKN